MADSDRTTASLIGATAGATRIALIHAVASAMAPAHDAFRQVWPDAQYFNILDDSLSGDLERDGRLTPAMAARFRVLTDYAVSTGVSGILFTCSAFGAAIEAAAQEAPIPVLRPNAAMFDAAVAAGDRIGMLVTFEESVASLEDEFRATAAGRGSRATIRTIYVPDALRALQAGSAGEHDRLIVDAARSLRGFDAVLLAQFSMARAEGAVCAAIGGRVLTSPGSAVMKLRELVTRGRYYGTTEERPEHPLNLAPGYYGDRGACAAPGSVPVTPGSCRLEESKMSLKEAETQSCRH